MPLLQAMAERANVRFNRENIVSLSVDTFRAPATFGDMAAALDIARTPVEREFLDTWPRALQDAIRAALSSAVNRTPRFPVTFLWMPGYDFEVMISEARTVGGSIGGVSIFLRSRYPGDNYNM